MTGQETARIMHALSAYRTTHYIPDNVMTVSQDDQEGEYTITVSLSCDAGLLYHTRVSTFKEACTMLSTLWSITPEWGISKSMLDRLSEHLTALFPDIRVSTYLREDGVLRAQSYTWTVTQPTEVRTILQKLEGVDYVGN